VSRIPTGIHCIKRALTASARSPDDPVRLLINPRHLTTASVFLTEHSDQPLQLDRSSSRTSRVRQCYRLWRASPYRLWPLRTTASARSSGFREPTVPPLVRHRHVRRGPNVLCGTTETPHARASKTLIAPGLTAVREGRHLRPNSSWQIARTAHTQPAQRCLGGLRSTLFSRPHPGECHPPTQMSRLSGSAMCNLVKTSSTNRGLPFAELAHSQYCRWTHDRPANRLKTVDRSGAAGDLLPPIRPRQRGTSTPIFRSSTPREEVALSEFAGSEEGIK